MAYKQTKRGYPFYATCCNIMYIWWHIEGSIFNTFIQIDVSWDHQIIYTFDLQKADALNLPMLHSQQQWKQTFPIVIKSDDILTRMLPGRWQPVLHSILEQWSSWVTTSPCCFSEDRLTLIIINVLQARWPFDSALLLTARHSPVRRRHSIKCIPRQNISLVQAI